MTINAIADSQRTAAKVVGSTYLFVLVLALFAELLKE